MPKNLLGRSALVVSLCGTLAACAENGDAYYAGIDVSAYPPADGPGEVMGPNEIDSARRIAAIIEAHLVHLYPSGLMRRDAHPKSTGCVDAVFTVNSDVPAALRHGIFATPGRSYRAVIRFSNSNEDPNRPDSDADGRGMAIKLFDLDARQIPMTSDPLSLLSPDADNPSTPPDFMKLAGNPSQDFITISHPTFAASEAEDYRRLIGMTDSPSPLAPVAAPFVALESIGLTGVKVALAITSLKIDNPLNQRYWSMVPYQLGTGPDAVAVKYSFIPEQFPASAVTPDKSDPNFLIHAMARTLQDHEARFTFAIQPRTAPDMSVEDPRIEWKEDVAPFHPVATIVVPKQRFDTPQRAKACELLSYSPWHALTDHKPLGGVNRVRKIVYDAISVFRRTRPGSVNPAVR